jgi:hypothetical protein
MKKGREFSMTILTTAVFINFKRLLMQNKKIMTEYTEEVTNR